MIRALLLLSLVCSILIINSCRSLYNNISDKMQIGLSAAFDTCNVGIVDSIAKTLLNQQRDSIALSERDTIHRYKCNVAPDTITVTQVNEKTHSLYIRRTSFDSLNYKIQTFSNYNLIQNSDTNIIVKINYIVAYKSTVPLKNKKDTTGYKMQLIMSMDGNKKDN